MKRALVIYKKSTFERDIVEKKDPNFTKLLAQKDPTTERFIPAHKNHQASIEQVLHAFKERKYRVRRLPRYRRFDESQYDIICTIGGDGTFLDASKYVKNKSMIGVNSSPEDSVGRFCAITADQFASFLDQWEEGKAKPIELARLHVEKDGQAMLPVLNDVLVCNQNPASTSRYILQVGKKKEEQKSSGIWISTAAGSTAAIRGAGGTVLPLEDKRYQWIVREPYPQPSHEPSMLFSLMKPQQLLKVHSKMREGRMYMDGSMRMHAFEFGSVLTFHNQGPVLRTWNLESMSHAS
jgi:NAD+ kinase